MKTFTSLALVALGLSIPSAVLAGANKTWVSGTGNDTGTCPITAPCASFQYAVNQTAAGGEVDVKDAGGYGTVVINKAISIVAADGVLATISVPKGGTGVTISTGNDDVVSITGLTIDGHLLGGVGIVASSAVIITKTTVRNLQYAIKSYGNQTLTINDSEISKDGTGLIVFARAGIYLGNNHFSQNDFAISGGNYPIYSYGDNKIDNTTISANIVAIQMK